MEKVAENNKNDLNNKDTNNNFSKTEPTKKKLDKIAKGLAGRLIDIFCYLGH